MSSLLSFCQSKHFSRAGNAKLNLITGFRASSYGYSIPRWTIVLHEETEETLLFPDLPTTLALTLAQLQSQQSKCDLGQDDHIILNATSRGSWPPGHKFKALSSLYDHKKRENGVVLGRCNTNSGFSPKLNTEEGREIREGTSGNSPFSLTCSWHIVPFVQSAWHTSLTPFSPSGRIFPNPRRFNITPPPFPFSFCRL